MRGKVRRKEEEEGGGERMRRKDEEGKGEHSLPPIFLPEPAGGLLEHRAVRLQV